MFPIDGEFLILYFTYVAMLISLLCGIAFTKKKTEFGLNLMLYLIYTSCVIYTFSDKSNFSGGNSLAVLFYGFALPIVHLLLYGLVKIIMLVLKSGERGS